MNILLLITNSYPSADCVDNDRNAHLFCRIFKFYCLCKPDKFLRKVFLQIPFVIPYRFPYRASIVTQEEDVYRVYDYFFAEWLRRMF